MCVFMNEYEIWYVCMYMCISEIVCLCVLVNVYKSIYRNIILFISEPPEKKLLKTRIDGLAMWIV